MWGEGKREHVRTVLQEVVQQLDPRKLVSGAIQVESDGSLHIQGIDEAISHSGRLVVIGVGKASVPMATGALDSLGHLADAAIAVTKAGIPLSVRPPESLEVLEADHPVPSQASLNAGTYIREVVESLSESDLVLMLISGGGSALIEDLVDGVTLDDLRGGTDHLLRAGANINELNAVRRRISKLKGGRLARAAAPARIVNLIISDVLNSPLQDIASGPTVEPPETDETFEAVMRTPELFDGLPESIRSELKAQQGQSEPWPDSLLGTTILADAETAARAAAESVARLGYHVQTLGFDFQGEARELGRFWGTVARHASRDDHAFPRPTALVGNGEATVTVRGNGIGGRNTEMALAAALEIEGCEHLVICSFATDGDDGLSECAGGIVDGATSKALRATGVDSIHCLEQNDSATALRRVDGVIDIGPTGTNVNDLYLALIGK